MISKVEVGSTNHNLVASNIAYGTCSTAAATAAKVITVTSPGWELVVGSIIVIKFSATNTASNPTFNVNSTGAKSVWYSTALITTSSLSYAGYANRHMIFVYDGTQYVFLGWSYDANTTYTNVKLGHGYATCSTAEATTAKVGTLSSYTLTTGGIVAVKFTYAVPASATLNINSKGAKAIYYRGAAITAGVIKAGDTATFIYNGSYYHLISIDRDDNTTITVDSALSSSSTNPVQNKVINTALSGKAASSHNQAASTITAGTFAGQVVAKAGSQAAGTSLLRNTKLVASETTPTNEGEIFWTYG